MSNKEIIANRKCSAMSAVGAGAAICLTSGTGALAASGNVAASNTGNITFGLPVGTATTVGSQSLKLFSSKLNVAVVASIFPAFHIYSGYFRFPAIAGAVASSGSSAMIHFAAGVTVSSGLGSFFVYGRVRANQTSSYIAIKFDDTGTRFGWVHVVSTNAIGTQTVMDTWGYNTLGGNIATLSDSVTTSRLALTDGIEKLHWTNENEDGVARYEVQSKDASGDWQTADSDVPGEGSYSAKVAAGATSRLVVEMTDGTTKEIDF